MMLTTSLEAPAIGSACPVAPGVLWARMPLGGVPDHINIFALRDGDGWTLVDTGESSAAGAAALQALQAGPLEGRPVHRVLVSHFHPDHAGQAGVLAGQGAAVWMTRPTFADIQRARSWCGERPNAEQLDFAVRGGLNGLPLEAFRRHPPSDYDQRVSALPAPPTFIEDGQDLLIDGRRWTIHCGAGHAPGHATFWSEDGLAIMGDHALPGMAADLSVRPDDLDADPVAAWFESCRRFAALAQASSLPVLCLPGHNLPFSGLAWRCEQLITIHERVLARLQEPLRRPRTALDCVEIVHGRPVSAVEKLERLGETLGYLNHLRALGQVERQEDRQGAWIWRQARTKPASMPAVRPAVPGRVSGAQAPIKASGAIGASAEIGAVGD